jgi:hypothetical protein
MFPNSLNFLAVSGRTRELRDTATRSRWVDTGATPVSRVTIRHAAAADAERLRRLAQLDSAPAPSGPMLVAEVDGRLRAALPLAGGAAPIADPFYRGAELLELLRMRAAQLARA